VSSYNLYEFWLGPLYPAWAYVSPIFPLLLAAVWKISPTLHAAILFNVIINGLNCALFYILLESIYKNPKIAIWSAMLMAVCYPMFMTALNVWNEQLSILLLLITILMFLKDLSWDKNKLLFVGILLGIGFLIKATIYNLLAFLIFLFITLKGNKSRFRAVGYLILGFIFVVLPYELFSIWRFQTFYPQHLQINTIGYLKAGRSGGYYVRNAIPVLRANVVGFDFVLKFVAKKLPLWIGSSLVEAARCFNLLLVLVLLKLFFNLHRVKKEISEKERLMIILALVTILGHAATIFWHPWFNNTEVLRFNLIGYLLLIPVAVAYLFNLLRDADSTFIKSGFNWIYNAVLFLILVMMLRPVIYLNTSHDLYSVFKQRQELRQGVFNWLRQNTQPLDIVASSEIQDGFDLGRPTVSLPIGKFLTETNIKVFLSFYRPKYILIAIDSISRYKDVLPKSARQIITDEGWKDCFLIYKL